MNDNIYDIGVDMDNRTPEEIARDAALKIKDLFDVLVEKQESEHKGDKN